MERKTFIEGIKYIDNFYMAFKFDFKNVDMIDVWYDILSEFQDEYFISIVKDYVKHNEYAPNSPASLISHAKKMLLRQVDVGSTFDRLVERLRKDGYDVDLVASKYEKGGNYTMAKVIRELRTNVITWQANAESLPYFKNAFEKTYAEYLSRDIDKQVFSITDSSRLLGSGE